MPTDTTRSRTDSLNFVLRSVAWSLGFFGLIRLGWMEAHAVLPFTRVQAAAATALFGPSVLPVEVTLACSGADAIALCAGAIAAYPVAWRRRLIGAAGGLALIIVINIVRIGTLGQASGSPAWFNALHLYVWPAVLTIAIAGYVFAWMRQAAASTGAAPTSAPQPTRRFIFFAAGFLLLFTAASPLYLESRGVLAMAGFMARAAAMMLGWAGVTAVALGNVLSAPSGSFLVTQECISTPLIPIYLTAICAYATTWRWRILGVMATVPLFTALGIARLLVVALPATLVGSPLFLVHAFYQLLLGAVVVCAVALWRHGGRRAFPHALAGVIAGVFVAWLIGRWLTPVGAYTTDAAIDDPQGAVAFLPAFQVGLYVALWVAAFIGVGWKRFAAGLVALELTQAAGFLALRVLTDQAGLAAHVRDVRGWAVAGPLLIVAVVINVAPTRR